MKNFLDKFFGTNTKLLTWTVTGTWVATVIMSVISAIVFGVDLVSLVIAVSASLAIVLTGYFAKSFNENKEINSNQNAKDDIVNSIVTNVNDLLAKVVIRKEE